MPSYTYPVTRPSGTLTAAQIHLILSKPSVVAKRVAKLSDQKFIADFLLRERLKAIGGGVFYETGEEVFAADTPEAVEAAAEYPTTVLTRGEIAAAKTVKWGLDTLISDENISRLGMPYVNRGLRRVVNSVVKYVDSVAWAVIASKVTETVAATGTWTSTKNIISSLLKAQADRDNAALGINLNTVALAGDDYATVMGIFLDSGLLPKDAVAQNAILTGQLPPNLLGFTWVTSPGVSGANPWLFDTDQLGGMADEKLDGPGYANAGEFGVESKMIREDASDRYRGRARRVTVPVVLEPKAGVAITGTGL